MIEVRLIGWQDSAQMLDLVRTHCAELVPHLGFDDSRVLETIASSVERASPTIFVAEENGTLIGYLVAEMYGYWFTSGFYVAQDVMFVRPEKRGSRAAVKLIKEFIQWGDMLGAKEKVFGTVAGGEMAERTARLFERLGAKRVGFYLKEAGHG